MRCSSPSTSHLFNWFYLFPASDLFSTSSLPYLFSEDCYDFQEANMILIVNWNLKIQDVNEELLSLVPTPLNIFLQQHVDEAGFSPFIQSKTCKKQQEDQVQVQLWNSEFGDTSVDQELDII